ncbi:MAG: hypothetical protein UV73_C0013G0003 [Candidatus Gottesmanbacteria bacterium GW2011_GWA2_43_14]|uniref:Uncharacterized protein n=1 Tax=Candidatus Gottesmanbacteria bacterium GW2011_GWA2_43_14 TaxID=1618443 RepID=A0A0G1GA58_9BACT|nr:MAG: hypothetical protein UV73_C0013G0003 [Candidatus Gottesmanbacteria bacterium GW2011_GWA2_43_14]
MPNTDRLLVPGIYEKEGSGCSKGKLIKKFGIRNLAKSALGTINSREFFGRGSIFLKGFAFCGIVISGLIHLSTCFNVTVYL